MKRLALLTTIITSFYTYGAEATTKKHCYSECDKNYTDCRKGCKDFPPTCDSSCVDVHTACMGCCALFPSSHCY